MVLWQQELYLHPIPSGDRSGLVFVFSKDDIDLNTAPRDTSLRRALLDHWQAKAGHYQKGPGHPGGIRPYAFHGELLRGAQLFNYGGGGGGLGVFREIVTHIKTTNWVLAGAKRSV